MVGLFSFAEGFSFVPVLRLLIRAKKDSNNNNNDNNYNDNSGSREREKEREREREREGGGHIDESVIKLTNVTNTRQR